MSNKVDKTQKLVAITLSLICVISFALDWYLWRFN